MYLLCMCGQVKLHTLPIKMTKHGAMRLINRFDMSIEELHHIFKTGKYTKLPKKEGEIGIVERKIGKKEIKIIFKINDDTIWIITVEGGT